MKKDGDTASDHAPVFADLDRAAKEKKDGNAASDHAPVFADLGLSR